MGKRTYQVVRDAVNAATGTICCNWCFRAKPSDEVRPKMRANKRNGHICTDCDKRIKERRGK